MDGFLYRVKAAQRDLIERCGGIMRVVEKSGYSKSEVGRWNNGAEPDLMPVGAIVVLERDCGYSLVTSVLAETNGRRLTDPDVAMKAEVSVLTSHSEVMRHAAEVANALAVAISDGHVTPSEATTVDRSLGGLQRATDNMRASLAVIKAGGGVASSLRVVGE
ncbi:hypothetical protein LAV84_06810 [Rhizobium sp. VS19-DR104.2]|uniref:hypothetical protein n=1 Tax=unclassified Rhizobium TaxID=2613769 RepID=UPI001CC54578|nr:MULTISPECIES: hypothetical protein [unclassified Rhizobium]MBZ5760257.1 hypothetical protein [Rhizobium sp. VS19-DR96]MBZ5766899.1 hypothetical protein [Rhizobium sp. VS19-DR129.2]MBZ5773108.1 hypothetical protein [Rhizobium sp. VS19-DRK62.2]MBZ5784092.1 hypothetical protein [Rhizobium sp. VS19-DR121]MBZ5802452.1 hypothetical protein [Rhizobium sp. VS19-DR181]